MAADAADRDDERRGVDHIGTELIARQPVVAFVYEEKTRRPVKSFNTQSPLIGGARKGSSVWQEDMSSYSAAIRFLDLANSSRASDQKQGLEP
jgi:hypothetical protein